ncbi:hypothetical protein BAE44_0014069 [Dichanthelium oligosanthes]|uniref:Mitochondrial splicing suppressor 51-like C-terminal domain-containing protein n=1 Tax=Dichanthelium oligosanthes TaxID=888268 RepID=A0A1E5VIJ3_9POAL|nr:hypothetical protein BAE44_0014069 [Dichanthelium oligosanthes]
MECAAKGLTAEPCASGVADRRCGSCGAVAYCSRAHQNHEFPSTRCFFLQKIKLHQKGLWKSECICGPDVASAKDLSIAAEWKLQSSLCPCTEPETPVPVVLASWEDYYQWRSLPLHSPVAVLLHWDSNPHLIVAPNAGVAAYPSWMPTIPAIGFTYWCLLSFVFISFKEIIRQTGIPAMFTDFCEEAAHLASCCISSITGQPLKIPVCVMLCHYRFFPVVAIEQSNKASESIMSFPDPGKSFQAASCSR